MYTTQGEKMHEHWEIKIWIKIRRIRIRIFPDISKKYWTKIIEGSVKSSNQAILPVLDSRLSIILSYGGEETFM